MLVVTALLCSALHCEGPGGPGPGRGEEHSPTLRPNAGEWKTEGGRTTRKGERGAEGGRSGGGPAAIQAREGELQVGLQKKNIFIYNYNFTMNNFTLSGPPPGSSGRRKSDTRRRSAAPQRRPRRPSGRRRWRTRRPPGWSARLGPSRGPPPGAGPGGPAGEAAGDKAAAPAGRGAGRAAGVGPERSQRTLGKISRNQSHKKTKNGNPKLIYLYEKTKPVQCIM